jgi:hypothetical protein
MASSEDVVTLVLSELPLAEDNCMNASSEGGNDWIKLLVTLATAPRRSILRIGMRRRSICGR